MAGNAEPWPRSPCGGNFELFTTAIASSAVFIWGTTIPLITVSSEMRGFVLLTVLQRPKLFLSSLRESS